MLNEPLGRGLDFEGYLLKADMNVPTMREVFRETLVQPEDNEYFSWLCRSLPPKSLTVIALSESWCGDCVENLPVIAKLASLYPCFNLAIFARDENLDIMDRYLTEGKRTIPVFVILDQDGTEIGRFIERPPGAHAFLRQAQERAGNLPDEERKRAFYKARTDLRKLYKEGLRDETVKAIRRIVERRYAPKNT